jgi:hypothetical protein
VGRVTEDAVDEPDDSRQASAGHPDAEQDPDA